MIYDLAEQLKDAGLPQKGKGHFEKRFTDVKPEEYLPTTKFKPLDEAPDAEDTYFPTLSELIESCSPAFRKVWLIVKYPDQFRACGITQDMKRIQTRWCKEDVEALAKLWLKSRE